MSKRKTNLHNMTKDELSEEICSFFNEFSPTYSAKTFYRLLSSKQQGDKDTILAILRQVGIHCDFLCSTFSQFPYLANDLEFVEQMVSILPVSFHYLPEETQSTHSKDKKIMSIIVSKDPSLLYIASRQLRDDPTIVLNALTNCSHQHRPLVFQHASERIRELCRHSSQAVSILKPLSKIIQEMENVSSIISKNEPPEPKKNQPKKI